MRDWFSTFAAKTADLMGSYWAFMAAMVIIVAWAVTGPVFKFSDTWQLIINTGTTIVTFLMVFLIQNTQNREARATQIKLDELIRAINEANSQLIDIEEDTADQLDDLQKQYREVGKEAREDLEKHEQVMRQV